MPDAADPSSVEALLVAVRDSLGVVRLLRSLVDIFKDQSDAAVVHEDSPLRGRSPDEIATARWVQRRRVRDLRWSDGVVLYAPLWDTHEHACVMGLFDIVCRTVALMLMQLSIGKPIRGGVDVGTGIEVEEQLFGAALVKAYMLESQVAQHPRIVVGEALADYVGVACDAPGSDLEAQFARKLACRMRDLLARDEDHQWILDYAGPQARFIFQSAEPSGLLSQAREFVNSSRQRWRDEGNAKLFERYSKVARYLDARAHLWNAP